MDRRPTLAFGLMCNPDIGLVPPDCSEQAAGIAVGGDTLVTARTRVPTSSLLIVERVVESGANYPLWRRLTVELGRNPAEAHHEDAVRQAHDLFEFAGDEDDRNALV